MCLALRAIPDNTTTSHKFGVPLSYQMVGRYFREVRPQDRLQSPCKVKGKGTGAKDTDSCCRNCQWLTMTDISPCSTPNLRLQPTGILLDKVDTSA